MKFKKKKKKKKIKSDLPTLLFLRMKPETNIYFCLAWQKTNPYKTNKQMHEKHTDQIPPPQGRW